MFKLPEALRRTINWSHERGTWQYDLLCLLIIAVIFLTPGSFFGDRDRPTPTSAGVKASPPPPHPPAEVDASGVVQTDFEVAELRDFLQSRNRPDLADFPVEALGFYLREQYNQSVRLLRYEQYVDSRQTAWYRVWFEKNGPGR